MSQRKPAISFKSDPITRESENRLRFESPMTAAALRACFTSIASAMRAEPTNDLAAVFKHGCVVRNFDYPAKTSTMG
ncbi:hypothetical protein Bca4012_007031 [Brassica carinata]|uniref:Uncharacterized protein n=1 Tax=Brassica oleracea TaxID=3712 RepID=A0A3P6BH88_BRAOL|nr:unnamed protein product [Brassica oleracea]